MLHLSSHPISPSGTADALVDAVLDDPRVARAVALAARDAQMRHRFRALRADGLTADAAAEALTGPYDDGDGRPYYLASSYVRRLCYAPPGAPA